MSKELTQEQMDLILCLLKKYDCEIITQKIWDELNFDFSKCAYTRKANKSNFLIKTGYSFEEFDPIEHSTKAPIQIRCKYCDAIYVTMYIKLIHRTFSDELLCKACYSKVMFASERWREKQRNAQKIAQNRPETLEKHRRNSTKMWITNGEKLRAAHLKMVQSQSYRDNMAKIIAHKWETDPDYRDRVSGKGIYKHNGLNKNSIYYHSLLELQFLLWCADNQLNVVRFDLPIKYIDPNDNKERNYFQISL